MNLEDVPVLPSTCKLTWDDNTSKITNPYTGGSKFTRLPGGTWSIQLEYTKLSPKESNWFDAFNSALRGGAATIRVIDYSYYIEPGTHTETITITTDAPAGSSIVVTGFAPNKAEAMSVGDRISFIDPITGLEELHVLTAVASSDSNGSSTLQFTPEIKRPPKAGVNVNISTPGFSANLDKASDGVSRQDIQGSISFVFREAIYGV